MLRVAKEAKLKQKSAGAAAEEAQKASLASWPTLPLTSVCASSFFTACPPLTLAKRVKAEAVARTICVKDAADMKGSLCAAWFI